MLLSLSCPARALATPFAYVTNFGDDTVSVIDTATNTVVATVLVGTQAVGVTVNPSGTRVYVTNGEPDNVVTVIDATQLPDNPNDAVLDVITVGNDPEGIDITPDGNTLYVTNSNSGNVSVINVANDTNTVIATIPIGNDPVGVATHPDGTRVYVAVGGSRLVRVINTTTNTVSATVPVGNTNNGSDGIATNPDGTRVYVTVNNLGLQVIDTDPTSPTFHAVIATIPTGNTSRSVAVNPAGTRAYVTSGAGNTVAVVNITSDANTVIVSIPVDGSARGVGVHPDGTLVYVTQESANTATVIDAVNNIIVLPPIPVGSGPIAFGKFIGPSLSTCPHDGDINQDGVVTPEDARLALHHFLAIADPPLEACEQDQANVLEPESSDITPADALCIFQRFLNFPSCFSMVDDHGNSSATATLVNPDSLTAGNLEAEGDVDVFRIDLPTEGTLTISTSGSIDTVGTIFDSSETMLATDDDSGDERNFLLSQSLSAGTYFVEVAGFSEVDTGSYTLVSSFVESEDEPPDTPPPPPPPGFETFNLIGSWEGVWQSTRSAVSGTVDMTFTQSESVLTGNFTIVGSPCRSTGVVEGTVEGDMVLLRLFGGQGEVTLIGVIDPNGDRVTGTYTTEGGFCHGNQGTWQLVRVE